MLCASSTLPVWALHRVCLLRVGLVCRFLSVLTSAVAKRSHIGRRVVAILQSTLSMSRHVTRHCNCGKTAVFGCIRWGNMLGWCAATRRQRLTALLRSSPCAHGVQHPSIPCRVRQSDCHACNVCLAASPDLQAEPIIFQSQHICLLFALGLLKGYKASAGRWGKDSGCIVLHDTSTSC